MPRWHTGLFLSLVLLPIPASGAATDLQALLAQAPAGSTVQLPPGRYAGGVTIDKALILRGGAGVVIDAGGRGTVLTLKAPHIVLEDLTIQGSGESLLFEDSGIRIEAPNCAVRRCRIEDVLFGIFLVRAGDAHLEDNWIVGKPLFIAKRGDLIRLWYSDRATIRNNRLEQGRDAVLWFSDGSIVENNDIRDARYGLHFMYTHHARVRGNRLIGNSVGAYIMYSHHVVVEGNRLENHRGPSGAGLGLKESSFLTITGNVLRGNRQGLFIDQSPMVPEEANVTRGNLFAGNDIAIAILPGVQGNTFAGNAFIDNLEQVSVRGGGQLRGNAWSENGRGNYWNDYTGYGAARSLVGRMPYRVESVFERVVDEHPELRFFLFTPASQALEAAGRAFPLFKPKPKLVDEFPLLDSPIPPMESATVAIDGSALRYPLGFVAVAGFVLFAPLAKGRKRKDVMKAMASSRGSQTVIEIQGLNKSFGMRQVLKDVQFTLEPGKSVVLWGPNGAGKSTLLRCILGLHRFTGSLRVLGHEVRSEGDRARRQVGYVAQDFSFYDWTVRRAMEFICDIRGADPGRITETLATCRLVGEEAKPIQALSGGMRQKLALAQALVAQPALLILDEPCANLDLKSRNEFLEILRGMKGARTLLLTSHHQAEVETLADHVFWMEEGKSPDMLSLEEFRARLAQSFPLWIQLEEPEARAQGLALLQEQGFQVAPNGSGLYVQATGARKMEALRLLENAGLRVRDFKQDRLAEPCVAAALGDAKKDREAVS